MPTPGRHPASSPSTGSPIGSSSTLRSILRPGSTAAASGLAQGMAGARASIRRPALDRHDRRPAQSPGQRQPRRARSERFREDSTRPSTRSGWCGSRPGRVPRALRFTGREYDTATRTLGPFQNTPRRVLADAPRALLQFTLELFNPTALITGQEGGRALLQVRGAAIPPAERAGQGRRPRGRVFVPLRLVNVEG